MPSGPKKRKAAKRKEKEQRQLLGVLPPVPPPSLSGGPPHSKQGNAVREEEVEDVEYQKGKGMENCCDVTIPMKHELQDNYHKQDGTVCNEDKIEHDSAGLVGVVTDSTRNFGEEQPHESIRTDEDAKEMEGVQVMEIEAKKDEVLPSSPLDNICHATGDVSVSVSVSEVEAEAVIAEHIQTERAEHVLVLGEGPSILEHKKWEPVDTATLSVSEEGNAVKEEEDVEYQKGKGIGNCCDVTIPMKHELQDNYHKQDGIVCNEDKIEHDSAGLVDVVTDSTQNFGEEQPRESFRTDEDAKEMEGVQVMEIEAKKDEVLPSSPLDYICHATGDVSVSEVEAVIAEHIQSERAEHVLVLGEWPSIVEHKKSEPVDTATLSVSEEEEQALGSLGSNEDMADGALTDTIIRGEFGCEHVKVKSKEIETYQDIATSLNTGSEAQMAKKIMQQGRDKLAHELSSQIAPTEEEAQEIVLSWAISMKRYLTPGAIKALSSALALNIGMEVQDFDNFLLGWDLRGEDEVNEIKNVMDALLKLLNEVLTSQREFRDNAEELLTELKEASTKMQLLISQQYQ